MKGVKGMRDLLGSQIGPYRRVLDASQKVLEGQYDFEQVLTNVVEPEGLYRKTLGVTSDIVLKEMYEVAPDSQSKKNERMVLRPEGTAGLMRAILADSDSMRDIRRSAVKAWYWGPMFRHERPQAGRLRQFYQLGVETVGGTKSEDGQAVDFGHLVQTDFEAIESAWRCLKASFSGFEHQIDFQVEVNNLGGENTLLEYNRALQALLEVYKSDLSEASQQRLQAGHCLRILDSKSAQDQNVISQLDLPEIDHFINASWQSSFAELEELLTLSGISYVRNPRLVRGLDYYNGTCFEIKHRSPETTSVLGPSQNTLLAGGRYDYLASYLQNNNAKKEQGRKRIPAIGWAAGVDRLALLIQSLRISESSGLNETSRKMVRDLGITSIAEGGSDSEGSKRIRLASYQLKKAIENESHDPLSVTMDLREKLKLNNRLQDLMVKTQAVAVIGSVEASAIFHALQNGQDLLDLELPFKMPGVSGHQTISLRQLREQKTSQK